MLDRARRGCGLPTTTEADEQERVAALVRPGRGPTLQRCAIPTCATVPTNGLGVPTTVDARRWHCPAHEHLAGDRDMAPHGSGLRYSESGAIVPIDDRPATRPSANAKRAGVPSVRLRRKSAPSRGPRSLSTERARDEQLQRELPPHLRQVSA